MSEHILVEYITPINNIINQNFQTVNRIKFLCFDVSKNYIIFGANSGGIYIFKRKPCQFLKLIPSKEGSASLVTISRDEKNVAIASSKGFVIILEDCFTDNNLSYQVYSHHAPNMISALHWNGNNLFCGDNSGKVSVINMMNFLSKAIFQAPTSVLMTLDSPIIQIDAFSHYLLISTQTRSYLCDTEKEEYRQIGVKLRDGQYGACFFNKPTITECETNNTLIIKNIFRNLSDSEQFSCAQCGNIKIFCARPGARLWQANFKASVLCTHQLKQSLHINSSDLYILDDNIDKLIIKNTSDSIETFNFEKLYCLDKFIITFKRDSFYVFDPILSTLKFWIKIDKIKDLKIIDENLYVWENLGIRVFSILSIKDIIIKTLLKKQYNLCGELCVKYSKLIPNLLKESKKIHLIKILKTKLNGELLDKITPILEQIDEYNESKFQNNTKIYNGIVTVDNLYDPDDPVNKDEKETNSTILKQQFEINKIHKNIETTNLKNLLDSLNFEEIVELFENFQTEQEENSKLWCQEIFLKQFQKTGIGIDGLSDNCLGYLFTAFVQIEGNNLTCSCHYPLPQANKNKCKYYDVGCKLMDKFGETIIKNVPYLNRYYLNNFDLSNLSLLVQYNDIEIIKNSLKNFTFDLWDETIKLYIKLRKSMCLNCNQKIDIKGILTWKDLGLLMIQSIESESTLKLLKSYSNFIPQGELDETFYQYCMLNSIAKLKVDLNLFQDPDSINELGKLTGKYINKKYLGETQNNKWTNLNCDYCNMGLNIPILEDNNQLECGHIYHSLCFIYNKKKCFICRDIL